MSEQANGNGAVIEDAAIESRLSRVRKLLAKAESTDSAAEREALNERAADLIAKYGIDRAMLAADGTQGDAVVDQVIYLERPFADLMQRLLWSIVRPMRGNATSIKTWDATAGPKARGGVPRGGWKYGLRVFAHQSDMDRIKLLYVSLRNQALAGASKIVNKDETFGQAQKADRVSYLEGFASAVYGRLDRAEREAEQAYAAHQAEQRDQAMLEGRESGPGVALVLADRRKAVDVALDLAYGITVADRARWAAEAAKRAEERADEEPCERCAKAKSGHCREHPRGRSYYRAYERKGAYWGEGYYDGQQADLGPGDNEIADQQVPELPE